MKKKHSKGKKKKMTCEQEIRQTAIETIITVIMTVREAESPVEDVGTSQ